MFSPKEDPTNAKEAYNLARNINQCDFLVLLKNKLTVSQSFVFIFVTIILLCHMNADIEEASIEEALFRKNGSKNTPPPTFPSLILLASLRFRRFVLPWTMAIAVVSLTLTNDLSMKNVLLNVVALEFILQAVSLLVKYCCRNTNDSSTNARVNAGQHSYEKRNDPVLADKDYSWLASRVETVVVGATMIVTVLNVMTVVEGFCVLFHPYLFSCDRLGEETLWLVHIFGSLCTCIVHALCYFFNKTHEDYLNVPQTKTTTMILKRIWEMRCTSAYYKR